MNIYKVKYYQSLKLDNYGVIGAAGRPITDTTSVFLFDYGGWRLS
ncbi:hypothetical protein [Paenibacillus lautus]|nr:hypothetical protein [Paenibacillus lautus]